MREGYHTRQKDLILAGIKAQPTSFTVKELKRYLGRQGEKVGETTVYRLINDLVAEGLLVRELSDNNETVFEYLEPCEHKNHFYLKCDTCGRKRHADCVCIDQISEHIKKEHKFEICRKNLMVHGKCPNCIKNKEQNEEE